MRQVLYVSTSTSPPRQAVVDEILHQSRHNNALESVTGLLWVRRDRFLQVLEGPDEAIALTFERIVKDTRHRDVEVLVDRDLDQREFGSWSMALRHIGETDAELDGRVRELIASKPMAIHTHFDRFLG